MIEMSTRCEVHVCMYVDEVRGDWYTLARMNQVTFSVQGGTVREPLYL